MEHAEARELLEIAAVEPGGFGRLAAGDTPEAAALAGHLAGCPECASEMERLRRASAVIRDAVRTMPPPELRDRTLALVGTLGRDRGASAPSSVDAAGRPATQVGPAARTRPFQLAGRPGRLGVYAVALAAVIAIAVIGTAALVGRSNNAAIAQLTEDVESVTKVASWTLHIDGQPDARHVDMVGAGTGGAPMTGTLVFSPGSGELVAFAHGLPVPPAGMQYRCWMEIGGSRTPIGQMFPGRGIAYWVGKVEALSLAQRGTRFGVSLVPAGGDPVAGDPILVGEL